MNRPLQPTVPTSTAEPGPKDDKTDLPAGDPAAAPHGADSHPQPVDQELETLRRLLLDDRRRVSLFARRFAPARCVVLDERCRLAFQDGRYRAGPITRALGCDGELAAIEPWRP